MGEHVGDEQYPTFVATVHRVLRPGGRFLVQQMSRAAGDSPGGGPFIEAYIAPDMHMRPLGETIGLLEAGGFEVRDVQAMREHYVRTGAEWLANLERRWAEASRWSARRWPACGASTSSAAALAFEERRMGVDQILVRKPDGERLRDRRLPRRGRRSPRPPRWRWSWSPGWSGKAIGRFNVIDVAWGLGFVLVAWVAFALSSGHGDDTRRVLVARAGHAVGRAARRLHRVAQPREGRGPALRRRCSRATPTRPGARSGIFLTQAVAVWFVSLPVQVAMFERSDPGALARRRRRGVGGRLRLRERRRLAARPLPRRSRQQGPGHGPRPVALHPSPELLRRRLRVVGALPRRRAAVAGRGHRPVAGADDVDPHPQDRQAAARDRTWPNAAPATRGTSSAPAGSSRCHRSD